MKKATLLPNGAILPKGFKKAGLYWSDIPHPVLTVITPTMAENWLKRNTDNRPKSEQAVKIICDLILSNMFHVSNDMICFDTNGNLINGQHRLSACVLSGKAITQIVCTGMPPSTFKYMDSGKKRTLSDVLHIAGFKYVNVLASIAKFVYGWNNNHHHVILKSESSSKMKFNNEIGLDLCIDNPDLELAAKLGSDIYGKSDKLIPASMIGSLYYVLKKSGGEQLAQTFFECLCYGIGVGPGSPIHRVRLALQKDSRSTSDKMTKKYKIAIIIKAWNYIRKGKKTISYVKWDAEKDKFPMPL